MAAQPTSRATALVPQPSETGVAHVKSLARTRLTKPPQVECLHGDRHDSRGNFARASNTRCRFGLQRGEQKTEFPISKGTLLQ